jgi:hypothetical protein
MITFYKRLVPFGISIIEWAELVAAIVAIYHVIATHSIAPFNM